MRRAPLSLITVFFAEKDRPVISKSRSRADKGELDMFCPQREDGASASRIRLFDTVEHGKIRYIAR